MEFCFLILGRVGPALFRLRIWVLCFKESGCYVWLLDKVKCHRSYLRVMFVVTVVLIVFTNIVRCRPLIRLVVRLSMSRLR